MVVFDNLIGVEKPLLRTRVIIASRSACGIRHPRGGYIVPPLPSLEEATREVGMRGPIAIRLRQRTIVSASALPHPLVVSAVVASMLYAGVFVVLIVVVVSADGGSVDAVIGCCCW